VLRARLVPLAACVERASPTGSAAVVDERRIDRADVFNAGIRRSDPVKPAAGTRVFHLPRPTARPGRNRPPPHQHVIVLFLKRWTLPRIGGGRVYPVLLLYCCCC